MNTTNDVKDNIYTHLAKDANQLNTVRQTEITQVLISILDQLYKLDNTIQRLTDINTTPHACIEIRYTKCITKHISLVRAELWFRGIIVKEKDTDYGVKHNVEDRQHGETSGRDTKNNKCTYKR